MSRATEQSQAQHDRVASPTNRAAMGLVMSRGSEVMSLELGLGCLGFVNRRIPLVLYCAWF